MKMERKVVEKVIFKETTKLLHYLGTPAKLKGHNLIRTAIVIVYYNEEYIDNITNKLYPEVARKYKIKIANVEYNMRSAIGATWNRGEIDNIVEIFGNTVSYEKSKPTNSEFIAMIVDYLRRKYYWDNYVA